MSEQDMQLQKELQMFDSKRGEWLAHHQGKFALVRGQEAAGFYDTAESAYAEGVQRWGNVPFLIKQVLLEDPIEHVPALVYGLINAGV
jgi:hypothetical protein